MTHRRSTWHQSGERKTASASLSVSSCHASSGEKCFDVPKIKFCPSIVFRFHRDIPALLIRIALWIDVVCRRDIVVFFIDTRVIVLLSGSGFVVLWNRFLFASGNDDVKRVHYLYTKYVLSFITFRDTANQKNTLHKGENDVNSSGVTPDSPSLTRDS